jgi:drug/metabolite transporter (DMT)-like permease
VPTLLVVAIIGGGIGPVLMLYGLRHLSGVVGALLLNLEAVFTALLAVTFFGERLRMAEAGAGFLVVIGAALVSWTGNRFTTESAGILAITGACFAWGLDNNLTARLSIRDPIALVRFKTLAAGFGNLLLAYLVANRPPTARVVGISLAVGFVCYGLSIVMDVYALRYLGAAREAAVFATAPFIGALVAVPLLAERLAAHHVLGGIAMAIGIALLIAARHPR